MYLNFNIFKKIVFLNDIQLNGKWKSKVTEVLNILRLSRVNLH